MVIGFFSESVFGLNEFDSQRRRFAAANAQRGNATFFSVISKGGQQRNDNARAGEANGVAERGGAAIDVHLRRVEAQRLDCCHRDDREGLINLE